MSKKALLLACLSLMSISAFAQNQVQRTEPTGKERVMNVGDCGWKHNLDFEGNVRLGYELPVTYCVEYQSYKAIKHGSGWNADYEPVSEIKISNRMKTTTESFSNLYSTKDSFDEILIQATLMSQCQNMKRQLKAAANPSECR